MRGASVRAPRSSRRRLARTRRNPTPGCRSTSPRSSRARPHRRARAARARGGPRSISTASSAELEADFWRTAEHEHPFLTGAFPVVADASTAADVEPRRRVPTPSRPTRRPAPIVALRPRRPPPAVAEPVGPRAGRRRARRRGRTEPRPTLPDAAPRARGVRRSPAEPPGDRAAAGAWSGCGAGSSSPRSSRVLGGASSVSGRRCSAARSPRRDVTVSVDGQASTIVTRAGTVGDLLASRGIVLHAGDRVVPDDVDPARAGHADPRVPVVPDDGRRRRHGRRAPHHPPRPRHTAARAELPVSPRARRTVHGRIERGDAPRAAHAARRHARRRRHDDAAHEPAPRSPSPSCSRPTAIDARAERPGRAGARRATSRRPRRSVSTG